MNVSEISIYMYLIVKKLAKSMNRNWLTNVNYCSNKYFPVWTPILSANASFISLMYLYMTWMMMCWILKYKTVLYTVCCSGFMQMIYLTCQYHTWRKVPHPYLSQGYKTPGSQTSHTHAHAHAQISAWIMHDFGLIAWILFA